MARARQGRAGQPRDESYVPENFQEHTIGEADEHLGDLAGVSSRTIRRVRYVMQNGTPEEIELMQSGDWSAFCFLRILRKQM